MSADRFKEMLTRLINELIPERRFLVPAEYRVDKCEGGKLTAKPAKSKSGLPPIVDMPVRGSIAGGMTSKLKKGSTVVIMWIDGSPAMPMLVGISETEAPDDLLLEGQTKARITAPLVELGAAGGAGVARVGDSVTITVAQFAAAGAANGGGPVTIVTDIQATITGGSSSVKAVG